MKTTIIMTITLLGISSAFYFAPQYFQPGSVAESVLIDKTDSFLVKPETSDIIPLLHLQENKWQKVKMRVQTISNFNYNAIYSLELPSAISLVSNPTDRNKEIAAFSQKAASAIDSINRLESELQNSCIYTTLITEVNKMASFNDRRRIVIVYSDLLEHSSLFNIYNSKDYQLLKTNREGVKELFKKAMKPTNLHGIQIYFVFKPKSDIDNASFALMSSLFKSILEDAGAEVYIGANLSENKSLQP
jgi:hypothetical protein